MGKNAMYAWLTSKSVTELQLVKTRHNAHTSFMMNASHVGFWYVTAVPSAEDRTFQMLPQILKVDWKKEAT